MDELKNLGRLHKCECGHIWFAPITLSKHTPNISGEKTEWCPVCSKKFYFATPAFDKTDIDSWNSALAIISN